MSKKVIVVDSWDELPEVLEPGIYIIGGEKHEIMETVGRDALRKAIERAKKYIKKGATLI